MRRGSQSVVALCIAALFAPLGASAQELHVTFVHTSDEHSSLLPAPLVDYGDPRGETFGGFARLATAVAQLRARAAAANEPLLVTSAGDNLSGTPFAWLALQGEGTELGLLLDIGYDAVALGNHEFDYDSERLARYIAAAGYPAAAARTALLAANTRPPPGHPLSAVGIERLRVRELPNGLRIGLFGLIGRGASRFATLAAPVDFTDPQAEAAAAVAELRASGAHIVVAITHAGVEEDRALARAVGGIDVILGGHDHVLTDTPLQEGGTIIVHPGAYTRQLFVLQLAYDIPTRTVRMRNAETAAPFVVALDTSVVEDHALSARIAPARARVKAVIADMTGGRVVALDQTVARSEFTLRARPPLQETPFGNYITDAMRAAVERASGHYVDFAFQANGVIRGSVAPGTHARRGDITFYDMATAVGLGTGPEGSAGYPLVSLRLTGEEVRRVLEISVLLSELMRNSYFLQVSGLRMRYDPARAVLFRIPFRGTPVPTGRSVLEAYRDSAGLLAPLTRGDTRLYHVVTDYYVASFLPMVGSMLPRLALVPKDADGTPLPDIASAIVRDEGRELKVWQAVMTYAAQHGLDVPQGYSATAQRIVRVNGTPLWLAPAVLGGLLLVLFFWWLLRRRRRAVAA